MTHNSLPIRPDHILSYTHSQLFLIGHPSFTSIQRVLELTLVVNQTTLNQSQPISNTYEPAVTLATSPPLKPQSRQNGRNCASHPPAYQSLGRVTPRLPRYTIMSKFRALTKKCHPDLGLPDASEAKIAAILGTYQDVCDEWASVC